MSILKIDQFSKKIKLPVFFLLLFFVFSFFQSFKPQVKLTANFSGEELFKGIYFLDDNVGQLLSNYEEIKKAKAQLTDNELNSLNTIKDQTVAYLNSKHPSFFNEMEASIRTGNPIQVKEILLKARNLQREAIKEVTKVDYDKMNSIIDIEKAKSEISIDNIESVRSNVSSFMLSVNGGEGDPNISTLVWVVVAVVLAVVAIELGVVADQVVALSIANRDGDNDIEIEKYILSISNIYA